MDGQELIRTKKRKGFGQYRHHRRVIGDGQLVTKGLEPVSVYFLFDHSTVKERQREREGGGEVRWKTLPEGCEMPPRKDTFNGCKLALPAY